MKNLWVIEIKNQDTGTWDATNSIHWARSCAREDKREYWQYNYPSDQFRIRKYAPVDTD